MISNNKRLDIDRIWNFFWGKLSSLRKCLYIYSADFHSVLKLCLDRGFAKLLDSLADHYKHMLEDQHRQK